ncbi:molybdopterin-containing oxidoreductase family protein [Clostridium autoethanogenum]|uniref:Molybdopterin oxidoreductase n=2 Tax=Clostridium autoethanogenum TaxID=84023 RepID=A0A3M0SKK6_9CLOT|nr:molybdopterin-dependent oxidoreductase [Clostridium autoethanogenum]AGY74842.1 molybdopterin-dependent oxidoreductase [Clostridium autoethanogenum DSM 10061]ALU35019.1 Molybdopterin oxidoreductase [Clostridium autoethanogenum DSM 10061]OVY49482.1 Perchlorate reductase subunit alpha precursor [Clostridium autoethanogenum]RMC95087.1 molybdopterin oxidoreductase [Clostridium autoethanogenum]
MENQKTNRSDFLNATNITGITSAVNGSSGLVKSESVQDDASSATKIVRTCCRACISNCGVIAHVKNGRVIKLEGDPENPMNKGSMCAKGLSGIQALYNPNRNKYPMLRVGKRGENKWKRISWDEAIDILANKLMETREKYGAEAVICSTGGGGNPEFWSISRFCNVFGTPNWFEPGCAQCYLPRTLANGLMYGGSDYSIADSNCLEIYDSDETPIKCLVMWGSAPSYSSPAMGGGAVADLRANGVKTVVIDPRMTPDAAKADVWLPIRPGSDVALMLAWTRYIIDKKLYDEDFVMKWTNLPYLVNVKTKMLLRANKSNNPKIPDTFMVWDTKTNSAKPLAYPWNDNLTPALEGTFMVNGIECKTGFQLLKERVEPYTLEKAAKTCWLDVNKIEEAINLYTQNSPSGLNLGVATDQSPNSVQAAMAAVNLNALMGNIEKPGTLMQRFETSGATPVLTYIVPPAQKMLPEEQLKKRLGGTEYKGLLQWWAAQPSSVRDAIITGKPYKPRVWIERSGNKLGAVAESASWVPALKEMDFIVHMYMYPTSFSNYADLLLPASEWLETDMPVESCNKIFVRQAVTHLWETMDETLFWSKLAKRCAELGHENCKKSFDEEYMGADLPYWNSMEELLNRCTSVFDMTWDEFKKKAPFEFLPKNEWKQYYVYKQIDPKTGTARGFDTPSKKIEIYLESLITLGRTGMPYSTYKLPPASKDYDPLPYYLEPSESPLEGSELAKEYPLVMTNGRIPFYHHNTLRNVPWLREMYPVPEIWIHPTAAKTYGISHGDWVWVESLRGKIKAKANVTKGINSGTVYMERFTFPENYHTETEGWREMNVNVLSKSTAPFNDVVGTYTLRGYLVKISRADDGPPKGVWTKPEQFKAWLPQPSDPTEVVK